MQIIVPGKLLPTTAIQIKLHSVHDPLTQHIYVNNIRKGDSTNKKKKERIVELLSVYL